MAGFHLSVWGWSAKPVLPVFCFCADGGGLPMGLVGDAEHGGGGSGLAVGRELPIVPCVGSARRKPALAYFFRSPDEYDRVRTQAPLHAVCLPAGDGIAARLSGGAAEAPARGEGGGDQHAVEGTGGSWADGNAASDLPGNRHHVCRTAAAGCVAGNPQPQKLSR